jgi:uridine kinase
MGIPTLSPVREAVLEALADRLIAESRAVPHPLRCGIDGRSAAGKTTLAGELAETLRRRGVETVTVSIDHFHRPGHKWRSIRGEWTPELRLAEGLDYAAFRELVFEPLGPAGSRRIRPRLFDSYLDEPFPEEWVDVSPGAILLSDAAHGFVPALRDLWDYRIWLDVDAPTMVERAVQRDPAWTDPSIDIRARYEGFWAECDALYERLYAPAAAAHCVVDNNDLAAPRIIRMDRHLGGEPRSLPSSAPASDS